MKVLFIARHFTYFRNYDRAIAGLASRGHQIHLAVEVADKLGGEGIATTLAAGSPRITFGSLPDRRSDEWSEGARRLRLGLDYLRYLDPFYDTAPLRRLRARDRTPRLLIALASPPVVGGAAWRRFVGRMLHGIDAAIPPPLAALDFVRAQAPDMMLITPLVDLGSQQIDYVRAARHLGIPTGLAVWSWDHLTSKALLREVPERVYVWNETQREEAIRDHGVPAERVVVTGAQCFDHWFERQASTTREAFCAHLKLPADRPLILYVCTGLIMGSPPEPDFVREWLGWLRASDDPVIRSASVLVRPHPGQTAIWEGVDLSAFGPVAIRGGNPIDEASRSEYFDALFHGTAVVGLNTSAFLEAAIVGREVLTVLVPRYHDNQDGTAHFRYLRQVAGGVLRVSTNRDAHLSQLADALRRTPGAEHPHRGFLESFIRPRGLRHAATPDFVEAVERLPECRVQRGAAAPWRRSAIVLALRIARPVLRSRFTRSPRELDPERLARIAIARADEPGVETRGEA